MYRSPYAGSCESTRLGTDEVVKVEQLHPASRQGPGAARCTWAAPAEPPALYARAVPIGEPLRSFEIGFPAAQRDRWRLGDLPREWFMEHPTVFDGSDLEIAVSQPAAHFAEWLVAIQLARRGLHVLVEKWDSCRQHPRKCHQARALLGSEGLDWFDTGTPGADLLVFDDFGRRYFVEVKLLPDDLSERQRVGFHVYEQMFRVPWFAIDVRTGVAPGLSDGQFGALNDALRARITERPQPPLYGDPAIPNYAIGSSRPARCHKGAAEHPRHAAMPHLKIAEGSWRCESCGAVKTRATVVEIVDQIQSLKESYWKAGGSRSRTVGLPSASLPEHVREMKREWERYSNTQIDLSWLV